MTAAPRHRANADSTTQAAGGGADQWACLTTQAASFWIDALQANLRNWRSVADAMTSAARARQDIALQLLQSRAGAQDSAETPHAPAQFVAPMLAAQKAYQRMGAAILEAQKQTLHALSDYERPH